MDSLPDSDWLLGHAELALGRPHRAAAHFQQGLQAARRTGHDFDYLLAGFVLALLACGEHESSAELAESLQERNARLVASGLAGRASLEEGRDRRERALLRAARRLMPAPVEVTLLFERPAPSGLVRLQLQLGERTVDLGYRRPWTVLWVLAQKRQRDVALPEPEQGWLDLEDLAHRADMEPSQVDAYISRARHTLGCAGLPQASEVVVARRGERRLGLAPCEDNTGPEQARHASSRQFRFTGSRAAGRC